MYRIQWAFIKDENGKDIAAENFEYHDTVFEYEDFDDAMEDRLDLLQGSRDKYFRVIEVE